MEELKSVVINIEMNKDMDDICILVSRSLFQSGAAVAATSEETNLCMKS